MVASSAARAPKKPESAASSRSRRRVSAIRRSNSVELHGRTRPPRRDAPAHGRLHCGERRTRANEEHGARDSGRVLAHGSVGHGRLRVLQGEVAGVLDDPYDLILGFGIIRFGGRAEGLAERVDAGKKLAGEELVDDGHPGRGFAVVGVEVAPGEDGRFERAEETGADPGEPRLLRPRWPCGCRGSNCRCRSGSWWWPRRIPPAGWSGLPPTIGEPAALAAARQSSPRERLGRGSRGPG